MPEFNAANDPVPSRDIEDITLEPDDPSPGDLAAFGDLSDAVSARSGLLSPEPIFDAFGFEGPAVRDRIVVLGRRRAGKTIYLARLYEAAWNGEHPGFHMRALPGPSNAHEKFMEVVARLRKGEWPESTIGSTSTAIDVEYQGERHLMIALDYPGEVFRRAFVHDSQEEAAIELREHVDRAAAVILLLDPEVAVAGELDEFVDDDYGMSEAIRRIRDSEDGREVPVAIVLTKCDLHEQMIKSDGGLREFINRRYSNIVRVATSPRRRFAAAAVRASRRSDGAILPNMSYRAEGILEPMLYCIDLMARGIRIESARQAAESFAQSQQAVAIARQQSEKNAAMGIAIIGSISVVLLGLFLLSLYLVISG